MKLRVMAVVALACLGCATTQVSGGGIGKAGVFIEPNFPRETINIRRVAVVPNRLPANLLDPEKWRRSNYLLVRKEFESRGFEVVDYDTTVAAFERSGLPVEDTKSSREKFAEFSQELGVDAVIVPYYGTFAWTTTVLVVSTAHFATVSSFQIYLAERNDFLARIDTSAETGYTNGYGMLAGLALSVAGPLLASSGSSSNSTLSTAFSIGGGAIALLDVLLGAIAAGKAPDGYWEPAFAESIKKGLAPFFDVVRPSYGGGARPAPVRRAPAPTPGYQQPAPGYQQPTPGYQQPAPGYQQPPPGYQPAPPAYQPAPYQPAPGYQQPAPAYQPPPSGYQPPVNRTPAPSPYQEPAPVAPAPRGCASDVECKGGRVCVQGQCTAPPTPAVTTCASTADCPAGKVCLQGQCL